MKALGVKTDAVSTAKVAPSSLLQYSDDDMDDTSLRDDERKAEAGFRGLMHTKKNLEKEISRLRSDRADRKIMEQQRHTEEAKRKLAFEQREHARDLKLE